MQAQWSIHALLLIIHISNKLAHHTYKKKQMCQIYATYNSLSSSADLEAALVCLPAETLITKKSKID